MSGFFAASGPSTAGRFVRSWALVAILAVAGAGAGYAIGFATSPDYLATSTLLVGRPLTDPDVDQDAIEAGQRLAATYADIVDRQPVLQGAARQIGLTGSWATLRDRVDASILGGESPLIEITVHAESPELAVSIAEAVNEQLIALSPTASTFAEVEEVEAFITTRLGSIQRDIAALEAQIVTLRSELETDPAETAQIRRHINESEARILSLQNSYASMLGFVTGRGASNVIEVLDRPSAGRDPAGLPPWATAAAGGIAGLLFGLSLRRYLARHRDGATTAGRPLAGVRSAHPGSEPDWAPAAGSIDDDREAEPSARYAYNTGRSGGRDRP